MSKKGKRNRRHNKQPSKPQAEAKPKVCGRCKKEKPLTNFGKRRRYKKISVNNWCNQCHREYSRAYRRKPGQKEKNAAYMREYMRKHRARAKQVDHPHHPKTSTTDPFPGHQ
jgi:hypothetical protein